MLITSAEHARIAFSRQSGIDTYPDAKTPQNAGKRPERIDCVPILMAALERVRENHAGGMAQKEGDSNAVTRAEGRLDRLGPGRGATVQRMRAAERNKPITDRTGIAGGLI